MSEEHGPAARFGTFKGVFTPTLLTILGVIMYLRVGWVVGNAGLIGALGILFLANLITLCTGLSLASIATNTRIGHGGPYAIINRSLGVEVGGAIGIPLYLTRPLGVAMYIFGFREGLQWIAPGLPALPVDLAIFAVLFGIAFRSADLAFRTQYVIMAIVGVSLVSIFTSSAPLTYQGEVPLWGGYPGAPETGFQGTDFWGVFAVFFPATTGILAGANMSGELVNPRRSIPVGTLAAIALSMGIYAAVAVWVAQTGSAEELAGSYSWLIDHAGSPTLVLLGLLGATASSALAGLVGGPRILMAMGDKRVVPYGDTLSRTSNGEPRNALVVTGVLTVGCIMLRDLNAIAPLVTMFFLVTYAVINLVVLFEDALGLVSYRPTLRVPRYVPLVGLTGCVFSMFIVHPTIGLVSVGMVVGIYVLLHRRGLGATDDNEVESTIFVAVAQWAASKVRAQDLRNARTWKPNVLVPVLDEAELESTLPVVFNLISPEGSVKLLGVTRDLAHARELRERLDRRAEEIHATGLLASATTVSLPDPTAAVGTGVAALHGTFFRPNLLFLRLDEPWIGADEIRSLYTLTRDVKVGMVLYQPGELAGLGHRRRVRMFVRNPGSWEVGDAFDLGRIDLLLLIGYRVRRLWQGELSVVTAVEDGANLPKARAFLDALCDLARLPEDAIRHAEVGTLDEVADSLAPADLTIFGLGETAPDPEWMERMTRLSAGACMFVRDSGLESARV